MSEPTKKNVLMESAKNKISKSSLSRLYSSPGISFSISSQSPLRNIRRRNTNYEPMENASKQDSAQSDSVLSPEAAEDCKENTLRNNRNRFSDSFSPLTLDTDIPIHPLQYAVQGRSTPTSTCSNPKTSSSVGQTSVSKRMNPKIEAGYAFSSPDAGISDTSTLKDQYHSDSKIHRKSIGRSQRIESPLKSRGSIESSKPKSQQSYASTSESSDPNYQLGTFSERLLMSDTKQNRDVENTIVFSNISDDEADEFDDRDGINYKKYQSTRRQDEFQQITSSNRSARELHSLCSCMTTIDELMRAQSSLFGISLNRASERDYKGETILHGLSNNKALATIISNPNDEDYETKDFLTLYHQPSTDQNHADQLNKMIESFLVDKLLPSFFGAPIAQDNEGQIPFEAGLVDWVATCHKEMYGIPSQNDAGYFSAYTNKVSDAVTHAWESTSTTFLTAMTFGRSSLRSQRQGVQKSDIERGDSMSSIGSTASQSQSFGKSKITPHARFCFRMLSIVLDEYDKFTQGFQNVGMNRQVEKYSRAIKGIQKLENVTGPLDLCGRVVEKIASIPHLLEVIFSINNDNDLDFVLSTKIVKKVLVDKHSVGPWLTTMLQSPHHHVSKRGVEYLQTVSSLCSGKQNDYERNGKEESDSESVHYGDLINEVSRLHDFVPSLLALKDNVVEEVSTTLIVKEVMDKMVARPFVATVVFCDAIFLFLMIFGFRKAVNGMIMGVPLDVVLKWIYLANTGIFYFIIAEIGKFVSLFLLSKHARNYILSFWNLIDLLAILLAALSSVAMRWQFTIGDEKDIKDDTVVRGLLAVTTGFLWLRVLNFLKAINMQLATFVLAILQITKDIFWFGVILFTMVISFSQMFFTLMAPPTCATEDISGRQCQQSEYLLGVYSILLGDFGIFHRDDFASGFSVFLVVLYTFFVTVVLLNVLIAIASDSYEKCLLKSQKLFGRARVMLIAELASFQSLLRRRDQDSDSLESPRAKGVVYSRWWTSNGLSNHWSRGSVLFFWLSMIVTVFWTFAELVGYFRGVQVGSILMSFSSVLINIALYIIIIVFLDRNSATKNIPVDKSSSTSSYQKMVHWILGVSRRSNQVSSRFSRGQEVWHGRVEFLQREMDRNMERQKELVVAQSECLQNQLNTSEIRVRAEVNQIDERFNQFETGTREVHESLLSAVNELRMLIALADKSVSEAASRDIPGEVDVSQV